MWAHLPAFLACAIGAGMGLYAMIRPGWAAKLVRLRDRPDLPGGFAEFRATYGGLFFATHAVAAGLLAAALTGPGPAAQDVSGLFYPAAMGALTVCAAIWLGTAVGRTLSVLADKTGGGFNFASIGFETTLGVLLLTPLIVRLI